MNLRLQLVKDIAADKITETDHVIMSLPIVQKSMPVWQAKIFLVTFRRNGMTQKHLYQW